MGSPEDLGWVEDKVMGREWQWHAGQWHGKGKDEGENGSQSVLEAIS
jgi:hypothetical protein